VEFNDYVSLQIIPFYLEVSMSDDSKSDRKLELWNNLLRTSLKIPGAKVDRKKFLTSQLSKHVDDTVLKKAIDTRPALAGISKDKIYCDFIFDDCHI
jgi:hypothetical protein